MISRKVVRPASTWVPPNQKASAKSEKSMNWLNPKPSPAPRGTRREAVAAIAAAYASERARSMPNAATVRMAYTASPASCREVGARARAACVVVVRLLQIEGAVAEVGGGQARGHVPGWRAARRGCRQAARPML